jgi:hypothetical protein
MQVTVRVVVMLLTSRLRQHPTAGAPQCMLLLSSRSNKMTCLMGWQLQHTLCWSAVAPHMLLQGQTATLLAGKITSSSIIPVLVHDIRVAPMVV